MIVKFLEGSFEALLDIAHSHHSDVPERQEEHHEVGVGGALRELGDEVGQREEEQGRHQVHLQHWACREKEKGDLQLPK